MRDALVAATPALLTYAGADVVPFLKRVCVRPNALLHTLRGALPPLVHAGAPIHWRRHDAEWDAYLRPFAERNETQEQDLVSTYFGWRGAEACVCTWETLYVAIVIGAHELLADAEFMGWYADIEPPATPFARGTLVVTDATAAAIARGAAEPRVADALSAALPVVAAALAAADAATTARAATARDVDAIAEAARTGRLAPSALLARTWTSGDVARLRAAVDASTALDAFVTAVAAADVVPHLLAGLPLASARRARAFAPARAGASLVWLLDALEPSDVAFAYSYALDFVSPSASYDAVHAAFADAVAPDGALDAADATRLAAYACLTPATSPAGRALAGVTRKRRALDDDDDGNVKRARVSDLPQAM